MTFQRPKRLPPVRSGIERVLPRVYRKHQQWVRGHSCSVPGCENRNIHFAHIKGSDEVPYEDRGGTGLKARDTWGRPLCGIHHFEEEGHADAFDKKYGIDRIKQARWYIDNSPHRHEWEQMETQS